MKDDHKALDIYKEILESYEKDYPENRLYIFSIRSKIGVILLNINKVGEAQAIIEKNLRDQLSFYNNKSSMMISDSYTVLAEVYIKQKRFKLAKEYLDKSIQIRSFFKIDQNSELFLNNKLIMVDLYMAEGNIKKALEEIDIVIETRKKKYKSDIHALVLDAIYEKALLYTHGSFSDQIVLDMIRYLVEAEKKLYSGFDPTRIEKYCILAEQLIKLNQLEEAERLLLELQDFENKGGKPRNEFDLIWAFAKLYSKKKEYQKALGLYEEVLKMQKNIYQNNANADIAKTLFEIAKIKFDQGFYRESGKLFFGVYDMQKLIFEDLSHPSISATKAMLISVDFMLKNSK